MSTVNQLNPKVDLTVNIYDQFYSFAIEVPVDEYDAVNSYFESVFKAKEAAQNFTVTLFRVAQESQTPVMTLLQQIQGLSDIQLTAQLSYYLNGLRSPTTLLGISSVLAPNYYTARNILL